MKLIVKYLSSDQYSHPSFVSTSENHNASYLTLSRLANKLKNEFPNSYLNVYQNDSTDVIYLKTTAYRNDLWPGGNYEIECVPIVKINNKSQRYVVLKLLDLTRIEEQDEIYDF